MPRLIRHFRHEKGTEAEVRPQVFLGLLPETHRHDMALKDISCGHT